MVKFCLDSYARSRYWPSVRFMQALFKILQAASATLGEVVDSRSRMAVWARLNIASPALMACATPQRDQTVGRPRRSGLLSSISSWISEKLWINSTATAAGSADDQG